MNNSYMSVRIDFPEKTEIRIGTALRIAVTYYNMLNSSYEGAVEISRLKNVLEELKNVYKFKSIKRYVDYLTKELLDISFNNVIVKMDVTSINKKVEKCGEKIVPISVMNYLNNVLLEKLVQIAMINMKEKIPKVYAIIISKEEYIKLYKGYDRYIGLIDLTSEFVESMLRWLDYNLILSITNLYVDSENKDIYLPVKFSFVK